MYFDYEICISVRVAVWCLCRQLCSDLGEVALVVQQVHDAVGLACDQVDGRLVVVELDVAPGDPLAFVLRLLQPEDVLVEVELEALVRVVDAQLLKPVDAQVLRGGARRRSTQAGTQRTRHPATQPLTQSPTNPATHPLI